MPGGGRGEGRDPIAEGRKKSEPTFGECADKLLASMEAGWRNEKHRAQWRMTLTNMPRLLVDKRVSEVETDDVLRVLALFGKLDPKPRRDSGGASRGCSTMPRRRVAGRGEPGAVAGPPQERAADSEKLTRGHHAAMPYQDVPAFVQELPGKQAMAARALEFLILTAARAGEVLQRDWAEMDLEKAGLDYTCAPHEGRKRTPRSLPPGRWPS